MWPSPVPPPPAGSLPVSAQPGCLRPRRVPHAPLSRTRSHCTTAVDRGPNEPRRTRTKGGQGGARINTARADPEATPSCGRPLQAKTGGSDTAPQRRPDVGPGDPCGGQRGRPPTVLGEKAPPSPQAHALGRAPRHCGGSHLGIHDLKRVSTRRGGNEGRGLLHQPALRGKELRRPGQRLPSDFRWKTVNSKCSRRLLGGRTRCACTRDGRAVPARAGPPASPRPSATRLSTRSRQHSEVSRVTCCSPPGGLREKDAAESRGPSTGPGRHLEASLSPPPWGTWLGAQGRGVAGAPPPAGTARRP